MKTPYRDTEDEARSLAAELLQSATHAALGVLDPETGAPVVTRIAFAMLDGAPHTLISTLSTHSAALDANPKASLLVGEPGDKGDPLTHPRITLEVKAELADKDKGRAAYLAARPKSGLYYDFTDFRLIRFDVSSAFLNGGFGKAYRLTPEDLNL